ncbi:hypothetical protein M3Y97_00727800 [Aphelenchoides bicaudatus]|nr:hypothetical protein M3Y97_00727800 [Aphelenchoides bicaudatus]
MIEQGANSEDVDNLKKNFDQSRETMLHQIDRLNKKVKLLEKDNADLKQQNINYMDGVAASNVKLQQEVRRRLNEIAKEIAGPQRKRPRLNSNEITTAPVTMKSDVQAAKLAKLNKQLNQQISRFKAAIKKKKADFALLNKQADALTEEIEQRKIKLSKAQEVHKKDCNTLSGQIKDLKSQNDDLNAKLKMIDHVVQDGRLFAVGFKNSLLTNCLSKNRIRACHSEAKRLLNVEIEKIEQNARNSRADGNFVDATRQYSGIAGMASTESGNKRIAADAWVKIGHCFDEQAKHATGLKCYIKAIEICPNYSVPYYHCALNHFNFNNIGKAQLNVAKCLELCPGFREELFYKKRSSKLVFCKLNVFILCALN